MNTSSLPSKAAPRRNVALLVAAQALYVCCSAIGLTLTGLVGALLAPSKGWATLPFALITVATALSTMPASMLMLRWGRRPVFMLGALAGAVGGGVAAWAIVQGSFGLFCLGNMGLGLFQACAQYYRFAVTEVADAAFKSRAIGWVIGGGVLAAVLGPTLATWARDAVAPHTFAGSYLAVLLLALLSIGLLWHLQMPVSTASQSAQPAQALGQILRRPHFIAAVCNGAVAYAVMIFVMTATPLAVVGCGLPVAAAGMVIQWHLLAMFAPGFFSGKLVARWGAGRVLSLGNGLFVLACGVGLAGQTLPLFGTALALYGLAWNLMFVGATSLLAQGFEQDAPADRARAQALNEFITFAVMATGSLLAGATFNAWGWSAVQWVVLPFLALAQATTLWFAATQRKSTAALRIQSKG